MDYKENYIRLTKAIVQEHEAVFERLDMQQLDDFMDEIIRARKIFVYGTGREGISMRGFAMRLAHLGKTVHWLMDDTATGMHEGDLFLLCDGRGDVGIHRRIVEQASKTGARIVFITGLPEGALAKKFADRILFVHSTVYLDAGHAEADAPVQHDVVETVQPMGNQFEQHVYLLMDVIAVLLKDRLGMSYEDMEANHRNIE